MNRICYVESFKGAHIGALTPQQETAKGEIYSEGSV